MNSCKSATITCHANINGFKPIISAAAVMSDNASRTTKMITIDTGSTTDVATVLLMCNNVGVYVIDGQLAHSTIYCTQTQTQSMRVFIDIYILLCQLL